MSRHTKKSTTTTTSTAPSQSTTPQIKYSEIREKLLIWYTEKHRKLPWRVLQDATEIIDIDESTNDDDVSPQQQHAYRIWISEIMSQQTQIKTVIPYFNKWMLRFPTLNDLADATLEDVNKIWSGLGYYRRAKYLHQGAQYIRDELKGRIPSEVKGLLKVPGIGPYTAGAIASIAFGRVAPIVDGNVLRLISRLEALADDIAQASVRDNIFWPRAQKLVSAGTAERPGDLNQSLMEMGATICLPKNAKCSECPVSSYCLAKKQLDMEDIESIEASFPVKTKKGKKKEATSVSCVFERRAKGTNASQYLMCKRQDGGLLSDLWEFPTFHLPATTTQLPNDAIQLLLNDLHENHQESVVRALGIHSLGDWAQIEKENKGKVTHIFTHISQVIDVWKITLPSHLSFVNLHDEQTLKWMRHDEFKEGAVSKMVKKIMAAAKKKTIAVGTKRKGTAPKRKATTVSNDEPATKRIKIARKQRKITDFAEK